jgi:hypothetical protein
MLDATVGARPDRGDAGKPVVAGAEQGGRGKDKTHLPAYND